VAPAWAAGPAACTTEPTEGCCANVSLDCSVSHQILQRNVLLIISDDQGYCSYRFLRETSNPNEGATVTGAEDLTCRYRNSEDGITQKKSFQFNRGTHEPLVSSSGPTEFVGVRTPTIDALAAQGAVFPRMHLAANVCDPSLSSFFIGKHLKDRDVSYLRRNARDFRTCECRLTNTKCGLKPDGVTDYPLQPQCVNNGSVNNDPDCPYYDQVGTCDANNKCQWTNPALAS
jgi:hypothetical protein